MVEGYNAEFEDKRIYQIVANLNIEANNKEIITSPIQVGFLIYFLFYATFSTVGLGFGSIIIGIINWDFTIAIWNHLFVIFTLPFFYLFWARMSNSFVILQDEIYVINSNFPFKSIRKISKSKIQKISVEKNNFFGLSWLFLSFYNYYLEIITKESNYRFYCAPLDIDTYDENLSKKTLDDLYSQLKNKEYPVTTTIKDL